MLLQIAQLMLFQFAGEAIVKSVGVAFPGPLCGMLLLLLFLLLTGGPSNELRAAGTKLIDHLGLLFVPAGSAIIAYGGLFAHEGLAVLAALFVSTTVAIHVAGVVAEQASRLVQKERAEPELGA